jgi:hypothetical protein
MTLKITDIAAFTCDGCGAAYLSELGKGNPKDWVQAAIFESGSSETKLRYELCPECAGKVRQILPTSPGAYIDERNRAL